jgi:hypothetical protein
VPTMVLTVTIKHGEPEGRESLVAEPGVTCPMQMIGPFYVRNAMAEIVGHLDQRFWRAHAP